jgi:hypothetical protein
MEFGKLTSREAMENRFKELRTQSRQELLSQIYGKSKTGPPQQSVEQELTEAFSTLLHNYDFDRANPIVDEIAQIFGIRIDTIKQLPPKERKELLEGKIQGKIEEGIRIVDKMSNNHEARASTKSIHEENNHFEWLGVKSKYTELRPIF